MLGVKFRARYKGCKPFRYVYIRLNFIYFHYYKNKVISIFHNWIVDCFFFCEFYFEKCIHNLIFTRWWIKTVSSKRLQNYQTHIPIGFLVFNQQQKKEISIMVYNTNWLFVSNVIMGIEIMTVLTASNCYHYGL